MATGRYVHVFISRRQPGDRTIQERSAITPAALRLRPPAAGDLASPQAIRAAAFAPLLASFRASLSAATGKVVLPSADAEQAGHLDDVRAGTRHQELVAT